MGEVVATGVEMIGVAINVETIGSRVGVEIGAGVEEGADGIGVGAIGVTAGTTTAGVGGA